MAMATRLWIGGHANNQANSANNWLPKGAPQPGDYIYVNVPSGGSEPIMNLTDSGLQGNTLDIRGENFTLNMTNATATIGDDMIESATDGNSINVNVSGTDTLNTLGLDGPTRAFVWGLCMTGHRDRPGTRETGREGLAPCPR